MSICDTYDAIILGAGHNGLILQAYLAQAGFTTLGIDRRQTPGGGLVTMQLPEGSGFFHNVHSFFHRGLNRMPWYRDLELARHGAMYLEPPRNVAMLCGDGRSLEWCGDFQRTFDSFAAVDAHDAQRLLAWRERFQPILHNLLTYEAQSPPLPPEERQRLLGRSAEGRQLLEVSRLSPLEFVLREFRNPAVQAALLFFNGLREVDLRCRGFGHHIPALLASDALAQICIGGSQRLADALVDVIQAAGGHFLCSAELASILVEGERAVGVQMADGSRLRATQLIASSLNPQQTFLELLSPDQVPLAWRERASQFRYNLIAPLFGLYINLRKAPQYAWAEANEALMVIMGLERAEQFLEIVRCHEEGRIPPTVVWGACPTRFDPSQAPAGCHTAFLWEKLPFRLQGQASNWKSVARDHGRAMLQLFARYAPGLEDAVVDWFVKTPLDTALELPNMQEGDLLVGAFSHDQIGYHRPFPGAGHYRTHLERLYLCGSCCHPGGNITGLPAYNAAQVIFADLEIAAAWLPPPVQERIARATTGSTRNTGGDHDKFLRPTD